MRLTALFKNPSFRRPKAALNTVPRGLALRNPRSGFRAVLLSGALTFGSFLAAGSALSWAPAAWAADAAEVEGHADDAHGGDGHLEPKGPLSANPGEVIWNLLVVLIVLAVLGKFVWPKILAGLKAREGKIEGDLASAEKANADAQVLLEQYQGQLADAQKQYQKVVDDAKQAAATVEAQKLAETEKRISELEARAASEISSAKEQALSDIYSQAGVLASDVAGRILQREINAEDHRSLIDESLAKLN